MKVPRAFTEKPGHRQGELIQKIAQIELQANAYTVQVHLGIFDQIAQYAMQLRAA